MRFTWLALLGSVALVPALLAQSPAGDWPMYRHDLTGSGYSPLKQIDTKNVAALNRASPLTFRHHRQAHPKQWVVRAQSRFL